MSSVTKAKYCMQEKKKKNRPPSKKNKIEKHCCHQLLDSYKQILLSIFPKYMYVKTIKREL